MINPFAGSGQGDAGAGMRAPGLNDGSSPSWMQGLPGMMGPLAGILGNLFGNYKNPSDAAMPYLNQIPGMMGQYYNPYINTGMQDMGMLQGQYSNLIGDPGSMLAKFGSGFQQSPGYKYQVDQATQAANNSAAAGGMTGSPASQKFIANQVSGIANQDYNNYLQNVMGLYGMGMSGLQQGNQMGYNASNELAQSLANNAQSQAGLAYAGQNTQNQQNSGLFSDIGSLAGSLVPFIPKSWF